MTRDHTPTPWQAVPNVFGVYGLFHIGADDDGKSTSIRIGTIDSMPNTRANADFLQKAVNAHDKLIELISIAANVLSSPQLFAQEGNRTAQDIRALLAKVQS